MTRTGSIGAEERVAAPFLAAANAFEQKGVIAARDLEEGGDGSLEVGGDFLEHGDKVKALGRQLLEFSFSRLQHFVSSISPSCTVAQKMKKGPQVLPAALLGNRFCDELQSRRAGGCIKVPTPPSRANISAREIHPEFNNPCEMGHCQPAVATRRKP
jgi:hypothetical protein